MEISSIIEGVYKELIEANKVAPYILGSLALIVFAIRNVYAYRYAMNYQEKFGIPHNRFNASFGKNLVETILYIALLLVFIASQYLFSMNYFKINPAVCAVCCTIFVLGYNLIVLTPLTEKYELKHLWVMTIVISILVLTAVTIELIYFPLTKKDYSIVDSILLLYSFITLVAYFVYVLITFFYSAYKSFGENANPQSGEYEVVKMNDDKYLVVFNTKDETILVKLKNDNGVLRVIKSDYQVVKSIEGKQIEYLRVEL